ncbi:glutamate synthase central domain protein [Mycobacterium kansasii]|uniref:Glutamate synthase central domain protein n=1 Tax=Mycobacterium kansasii TaxID=1768 RepID=A0A1V3XAT0_MYCKA|nr:glutamate synthase central domain protein [Mycobacterium kansasii]
MSKMGISTLASYTGAQLFQAVGISEDVLDEYFTGLTCPTGGITLDDIAADVASRHSLAYLDRPDERAHRELEVGGEYQWRREGEYHLFNPRPCSSCSTPPGPGNSRFSRSTPGWSTTRASGWRHCVVCSSSARACGPGAAGGGRARQRDRQALRDGGDELRLDLRGGARDAGDRDEPAGCPLQQR